MRRGDAAETMLCRKRGRGRRRFGLCVMCGEGEYAGGDLRARGGKVREREFRAAYRQKKRAHAACIRTDCIRYAVDEPTLQYSTRDNGRLDWKCQCFKKMSVRRDLTGFNMWRPHCSWSVRSGCVREAGVVVGTADKASKSDIAAMEERTPRRTRE